MKYVYKNRLLTSELGVTEHIEGDECKFAVWTGRAPTSDTRVVLRANSMDAKQLWVMRLREVIQETFLGKNMPKSPAKKSSSQRSSRDLEECASLDESVENLDRNSLASFGSTNTTDSDKVKHDFLFLLFLLHLFSYQICLFHTFFVQAIYCIKVIYTAYNLYNL